MPVNGPTVVRRELGRTLRKLREMAGKTPADVVASGEASVPTLRRIEKGMNAIKPGTVRELCTLYGVDAAVIDALCELARGSQEQGWWEGAYSRDVPGWFGLYVGLESVASEISTFHPGMLPGLLQTAEYARAVLAANNDLNPRADRNLTDRQVAVRMKRQDVAFKRTPPVRLTSVLDNAVLCRPVGGAVAMARQVEHLRDMNRRDHIDIRVLPWAVGEHAAMLGAFILLDFEDPDDPPVMYVETHGGARYHEKNAELVPQRRIFDRTYELSVPLEEYLS